MEMSEQTRTKSFSPPTPHFGGRERRKKKDGSARRRSARGAIWDEIRGERRMSGDKGRERRDE